ncbi:WXG100 family type VII secretion target [Streptomyces sp. NPDC060198]|uniref:WXG100 family type VII secretion target n=1 Tax=Streptomyces sp. NPDC060198 TaxID=3347070 RepID=UPI00366857EE
MIPQPDLDAPYASAAGVVDGTITVDGSHLVALANTVGGPDGSGGLVEQITDTLRTLFDTLDSLQLGWQGDTQAEAQEFADRLSACLATLLGTSDEDAKYSVLNRVSVALSGAGNNYLLAEDAVVKMFTEFGNALASGGGGAATPVSITDVTQTAISETF